MTGITDGKKKDEYRVPHLEIKKGEWYVCVNDWSDDGWSKFRKGDVLQAIDDYTFRDGYGIDHRFHIDGICYWRPACEDEIPDNRDVDVELTDFEKALYDLDIVGVDFICDHNLMEIKMETKRIAGDLLAIARRQIEKEKEL